MSVSTRVSTVDQLVPAWLMTPTRLPHSSMTQSPASMPREVPLFSVREEVQLLTACSVTMAASKSVRSRRCFVRFISSRNFLFSSTSASAWRMVSSILAICWRRAAFSAWRSVVSL